MPDTETTSTLRMLVNAGQAHAEMAKLDEGQAKFARSSSAASGAATANLSAVERSTKSAAVSARDAQVIYDNVVRSQGAGSQAARDIAVALGMQTVATEAATGATVVSTAVEKASTAATTESTSAWMRKTNMINTGQGPLRGYDALVQAVARSMGGIPIAAAVAIPIILALAAAFARAGDSKKENIKLDEEGLKLDIARRGTMAGQQALWTNLQTTLIQYRNNVKAFNIDQQKEVDGFYALVKAQEAEDDMKRRGVERTLQARVTGELLDKMLGSQTDSQQKLTEARLKDSVELNKSIEALIRYVAASNQGEQRVLSLAKSLHFEADEIAELTKQLNGGALAIERFNLAMDKARSSDLDFSKTRAGVLALQDSVKSGFLEAWQAGLTGWDERVRANTNSLGKLSAAVKEHTVSMAELDPNVQAAIRRHDELTGVYKREQAAIRESTQAEEKYASVVFALQKELFGLEEQLGRGDFDKKREIIQNEFLLRKAEMQRRKALTQQTLEFLLAIEAAQLQTVTNEQFAALSKRADAEEKFRVEIAKLNSTEALNEIEARRRTVNEVAAERHLALVQEFGDSLQTTDKIIEYDRAAWSAFLRWQAGQIEDANRQRLESERRFLNTLEDERLKRDKEIMERGAKVLIESYRRIGEINRQFSRSNRMDITDPAQLQQLGELDDRMRKLGIDVRTVDRAFGSASNSVNVLAARIRLIEKIGPQAMDALANKISITQQGFQTLFSAISAGFEALVSGSASFGDAMLKTILQAIAQIAAAWGSMWIAQGVSELFTPGMHHAGVVHIAQGGILLALAGALAGASALIGGGSKSAASGGGSESAGGSTSASTSTENRNVPQPTIINVPTSPQLEATQRRIAEIDSQLVALHRLDQTIFAHLAGTAERKLESDRSRLLEQAGIRQIQPKQQPIILRTVIQLDRQGSQDFLDGKGVITRETIGGKDRQHARRALGMQKAS